MSRRVNVSGNQGSIIAVGDHASASGTTNVGAPAATVEALRQELDALDVELAGREPTPQVRQARRRVAQLDGTLEEGAEPEQVRSSWGRLKSALAGLAVTANLAQIGQLVDALLT